MRRGGGNPTENDLRPLQVYRFQVDFERDPFELDSTQDEDPQRQPPRSGSEQQTRLCSGAFSECTGLEATMEPKVIKEGGRNYGANQRSGSVTFSTVILRRGMTTTRDLWKWFDLVTRSGAYAYRLAAIITMYDPGSASNEAIVRWKLDKALPIKFRAADLNARGNEIGIEELHLTHEGLSLVDENRARSPSPAATPGSSASEGTR